MKNELVLVCVFSPDGTTAMTDDMTGVMTAMEKADVAFKTLLAIRSKLMDAYDEVKNISI
jgi:flagellar hook-basal body complex protein FliE